MGPDVAVTDGTKYRVGECMERNICVAVTDEALVVVDLDAT